MLTVDDVVTYVNGSLGNLGTRSVSVELEKDEHFTKLIIPKALRRLSHYDPAVKYKSVDVVAGQSRVPLTPDMTDVFDVQAPVEDLNLTNLYELDEFRLAARVSRMSRALPEFAAVETFLDTYRQILGVDLKAMVVNDDNGTALYITPAPTSSITLTIGYVQTLKLEQVTSSKEDWFLDYCLALGKKILGEKRAKWPTIPGVEGTTPRGEALITAAEAEIQRLEEEIKSRRRILPPSQG